VVKGSDRVSKINTGVLVCNQFPFFALEKRTRSKMHHQILIFDPHVINVMMADVCQPFAAAYYRQFESVVVDF
jgi:hypothetical protein